MEKLICFTLGTALNVTSFPSIANDSSNATAVTLSLALNAFFQIYSYAQRKSSYEACYLRWPYNESISWPRREFEASVIFMRNLYADNMFYGCDSFTRKIADCFCNDIIKAANKAANSTPPKLSCQLTDRICICPYPYYKPEDDVVRENDFFVTELFTASMFLYFCSIPASLLATILALVVWARNQHLQTVTNIFVINLIVANGAIALLRSPVKSMESFAIFGHRWIIPQPFWLAEVSCRIYSMFRELSMVSTIYFLAIIGYERYQAICHPLESQRQLSRGRARKLVAAIWLWSAVLSIPAGYVNGAVLGNITFAYHPICASMDMNHYVNLYVVENIKNLINGYQLFVSGSQFFLPTAILLVVYGKILFTLYKRSRNVNTLTGETNMVSSQTVRSTALAGTESKRKSTNHVRFRQWGTQQAAASHRSRRATLMCSLCLATFILLWTPLQFALSVRSYYYFAGTATKMASLPTELIEMIHTEYVLLFDAIASTFTFFNPAIYCFTNRQWLASAKKMLASCLRLGKGSGEIPMNDLVREKSSTSTSDLNKQLQPSTDSINNGTAGTVELDPMNDALTHKRRSP